MERFRGIEIKSDAELATEALHACMHVGGIKLSLAEEMAAAERESFGVAYCGPTYRANEAKRRKRLERIIEGSKVREAVHKLAGCPCTSQSFKAKYTEMA